MTARDDVPVVPGRQRPASLDEALTDCWRALAESEERITVGQTYRFCALPARMPATTFKVLHVTQSSRLEILVNGRTRRTVDANLLNGCLRHGVIEPA